MVIWFEDRGTNRLVFDWETLSINHLFICPLLSLYQSIKMPLVPRFSDRCCCTTQLCHVIYLSARMLCRQIKSMLLYQKDRNVKFSQEDVIKRSVLVQRMCPRRRFLRVTTLTPTRLFTYYCVAESMKMLTYVTMYVVQGKYSFNSLF